MLLAKHFQIFFQEIFNFLIKIMLFLTKVFLVENTCEQKCFLLSLPKKKKKKKAFLLKHIQQTTLSVYFVNPIDIWSCWLNINNVLTIYGLVLNTGYWCPTIKLCNLCNVSINICKGDKVHHSCRPHYPQTPNTKRISECGEEWLELMHSQPCVFSLWPLVDFGLLAQSE